MREAKEKEKAGDVKSLRGEAREWKKETRRTRFFKSDE